MVYIDNGPGSPNKVRQHITRSIRQVNYLEL